MVRHPSRSRTLLTSAGPIVRITPSEVHINDPDYFDTIYSSTVGYDKVPEFIDWTNGPGSVQSTVEHELHKLRRTALDRHFSKRQITLYAPEIQERSAKLCNMLNMEYKGTGKALELGSAFGCYATDVVTEYVFAREYRYMDYPNFAAPYVKMAHNFVQITQLIRLIPILRMFLFSLPDRVVSFLSPATAVFFDFKNVSLQVLI